MTKPNTKSTRIDCRIRPEVKEAATQAAQEANRSLASYVETVLMEALRKAGYLK